MLKINPMEPDHALEPPSPLRYAHQIPFIDTDVQRNIVAENSQLIHLLSCHCVHCGIAVRDLSHQIILIAFDAVGIKKESTIV